MMAPFATSEEDGGFGIYGDKTRYATLQKKRETVANNHRGYETMRNLRTSIPSLVSIFRLFDLGHNVIVVIIEPRSHLCRVVTSS